MPESQTNEEKLRILTNNFVLLYTSNETILNLSLFKLSPEENVSKFGWKH